MTLPGNWTPLMLLGVSACAGVAGPKDSGLLERILAAEVRRQAADIEQLATLQSEDPALRRWLVRAQGRMDDPDCVDRVCEALSDPDPSVRREAVFALGQVSPRYVDTARGALLPALEDGSPIVRQRVLEALGKLGDPRLLTRLLPFVSNDDARVRGAAVLAVDRLRKRALKAEQKLAAAEQDRLIGTYSAALEKELSPEVRWKLIYALSGMPAVRVLPVLLDATRDPSSVEARVFAVRGLAELARRDWKELDGMSRKKLMRALLKALQDPRARVVIEAALALGDPSRQGRNSGHREQAALFQELEVLEALNGLMSRPEPHVAAAAVRGVGHFLAFGNLASQALSYAVSSSQASVKAEAIQALARLRGSRYEDHLKLHAGDTDWRIRVAVARSLRFLPVRSALALARKLSRDSDRRVILAALDALRPIRNNRDAMALASGALEIQDQAIREMAADVLRAVGDATVLPALRRSYLSSSGPEFADARREIIKSLGTIGRDSEGTRSFLMGALEDSAYSVRKEAHRALEAFGDETSLPGPERPAEVWIPHLPEKRSLSSFVVSRPRIRLETEHGAIVLELWPSEAPNHVYNLLSLVRAGRYDGRIFHRVVANFVVQGGDSRGDGYGARAFHGGTLRDEINPRPFLAGTLGMPKSAEPDSGGEQIFITTLPTPHLDGRYTAFGRVVEGFPRLLRLEVGDRILKATVLPRQR